MGGRFCFENSKTETGVFSDDLSYRLSSTFSLAAMKALNSSVIISNKLP